MGMNCLAGADRCLNCAEPLGAEGHDRDACVAELVGLGFTDDRAAGEDPGDDTQEEP